MHPNPLLIHSDEAHEPVSGPQIPLATCADGMRTPWHHFPSYVHHELGTEKPLHNPLVAIDIVLRPYRQTT